MNILSMLKGEITEKDLIGYYDANINYIELPKLIYGCLVVAIKRSCESR